MPQEPNNEARLTELRIQGVPPRIYEEIKSIATYAGVSVSNLLRSHLIKIAESYPERARTFKAIPWGNSQCHKTPKENLEA